MRKTFLILLSILLLLTSKVYASDENLYVTKMDEMELDNGRAWLNLDLTSKVAYIKGLSLGMTFGSAVALRELNLRDENEKNKVSKALQATTPNATYTEIIEYIDELYKNPLYRTVTIADAYFCMAFEQIGKVKKSNRDEFLQRTIAAY